MNVARRNRDRGVAGDLRQCPNIATRLPEPCKKGVPKGIEHERTNGLLVSLRSLLCDHVERLGMLLSEAGRLDVATARWRGPNPAFERSVNRVPS